MERPTPDRDAEREDDNGAHGCTGVIGSRSSVRHECMKPLDTPRRTLAPVPGDPRQRSTQSQARRRRAPRPRSGGPHCVLARPVRATEDHVDAFTVDRDADVSRQEFDAIVWRLRVLAEGSARWLPRSSSSVEAVDPVADGAARSWWASIRHAPRTLRGWIAGETGGYLLAGSAIVVVAVAIRVAYLDVPLRYDEATTYNNFVSKPLYVALANYATPNNHLLHTFLAKVSVGVFGSAEWAIRLPRCSPASRSCRRRSRLRACTTVALAALLAAALVASSSTLVEYSTNARGYTLVALATVLVFLAAARALETDSLGAWAAIAVAERSACTRCRSWSIRSAARCSGFSCRDGCVDARSGPLFTRLGSTALVTVVLTLILVCPGLRRLGDPFGDGERVRRTSHLEHAPRPLPGAHLRDRRDVDSRRPAGRRDPPRRSASSRGSSRRRGSAASAFRRCSPSSRVRRRARRCSGWFRTRGSGSSSYPLVAATTAGLYGWLFERRAWALASGRCRRGGRRRGIADRALGADSVRESRETGALLDAPAIAAFLAGESSPTIASSRRAPTRSSSTTSAARGGRESAPLHGRAARPHVRRREHARRPDDRRPARAAAEPGELGRPELLTSFDSGRVFLVERPA